MNFPESSPFERDVIHNRDCSTMGEIPDNAIDLVISGPPYWTFIDYKAFNEQEDYLWIDNTQSYADFLEKFEIWHKECFRVLRDGRYCAVNLATMARGKVNLPIPFHAVPIMEKIGFTFDFEIVWHKVSGGRTRARNFIQRPYPGSFTPNIRTEYLLIFRKNPDTPFDIKGNLSRKDHKISIDDYFIREIANNVWHVPPPHKGKNPKHPCPFPVEIPSRLIELFSLPGETVLDPFMGIGTTAIAAKYLDRRYIGYELVSDFIRIANEELSIRPGRRPEITCKYIKVQR